MNTYDSLEDYTADVERAVRAYREDQTAEQGLCVTCETRKRDIAGRHRRCWSCRRTDYMKRGEK